MRLAEQIARALLDESDKAPKDWLLAQDYEERAEQIDGDMGSPWTYGGAWKSPHSEDDIFYIRGLEGEGIKDVESWDIEVPEAVEAAFIREAFGRDVPYRRVSDFENITDPDDPGRYLYRDEEGEVEDKLEEYRTQEAERRNAAITMPVYHFLDDYNDSDYDDENLKESSGMSDEDWAQIPDSAKLIEYGRYHGFEELDSYPEKYTKAELAKLLNWDEDDL